MMIICDKQNKNADKNNLKLVYISFGGFGGCRRQLLMIVSKLWVTLDLLFSEAAEIESGG